jgi:hypothetical protein
MQGIIHDDDGMAGAVDDTNSSDFLLSRRSDSDSQQPSYQQAMWHHSLRYSKISCFRFYRYRWKLGVSVLLSLFSILYAIQRKGRRTSFQFTDKPIRTNHEKDQQTVDNLLYQCPTQFRNAAENVVTAPNEHKLWYEAVSESISNVTAYMETFREMEFDNWGHTYAEVKRGMFSWKSHYFSDLKSGDLVYESACGIGMNLFMTLEILQQVLGVTNITIYGNDYVSRSVEIAQLIYSGMNSKMFPSSFGRLGAICTADSTQLDFVPSNAFDLVYTGYISPLFDPLRLNQSTDENFVQYNAYCEQAQDSISHFGSTAIMAQERQNDWYGAWVGEMIRIAKPGAPIIVEQVSYPYVFFM